jgi:hypothetical protein
MANNLTLICNQRKRQQLFNIPPIRVELQTSPYLNGFTQSQLDMRRKVEILKYNPVLQGNQTNSLTRSERWAQIVNGFTQRRSSLQTTNRDTSCPDDDFLHIPTSSSDVPGKVVDLYLDPNVPLYNYIKSGDPYSILPPEDTIPWSVSFTTNNTTDENTDNEVLALYIRSIEDSTNSDIFTLTTPIAYYITGTCTTVPTGKLRLMNNNMEFKMLYGDSNVLVDTPSISFNPGIMDISLNSIGNFSAKLYVGNLIVSNIDIVPQYKFIYDLKFYFDITSSFTVAGDSIANNLSNFKVQYIVNLSSNTRSLTNCSTTYIPVDTFRAPTNSNILVKNS